MSENSQTPSQLEIPGAVEQLGLEITGLNSSLDRLDKRLSAVLRPSSPCAATAVVKDDIHSSLGLTLLEMGDRVREARVRIVDLEERCGL
jgi:hypothetical protein